MDRASTGERNPILAEYRMTVMETPDFETAYSTSLPEHLEAEFTASIADALLSDKPLTQKQKRDLLLATTDGINDRREFIQVLELESLQDIRETVTNVKSTFDELSPCSIQRASFDRYLDVWGTTGALAAQCEEAHMNAKIVLLRSRKAI